MSSTPRTSRRFLLRNDVLQRLDAMAATDRRTANNLLECVLIWALAQPDLMPRLKAAQTRRPVTLGDLLCNVIDHGRDMARTVAPASSGGAHDANTTPPANP